MDNSMFISSEKAGILEQLVQSLWTIKLKRRRQAEFGGLVKALKGLKLLHPETKVFDIGWGCSVNGETGLIVTFEVPLHVQAPMPNQEFTP